MGAPKGNLNAVRNKPWKDALRRALARKSGSVNKGLNYIADQVLDAAIKGDVWAIREVSERMDGKAAQEQILTGDEEGGPIKHSMKIKFV